jgi:hypothetical protein
VILKKGTGTLEGTSASFVLRRFDQQEEKIRGDLEPQGCSSSTSPLTTAEGIIIVDTVRFGNEKTGRAKNESLSVQISEDTAHHSHLVTHHASLARVSQNVFHLEWGKAVGFQVQ